LEALQLAAVAAVCLAAMIAFLLVFLIRGKSRTTTFQLPSHCSAAAESIAVLPFLT